MTLRNILAALSMAGAVALSAPTIAQAGDSQPAIWTGVYVGSHLGYSWSKVELSEQDDAITPRIPVANVNARSWITGGHFGMNVQQGNWVYGGELSLSIAPGGAADKGCTYDSQAGTCRAKMDWLALALTRIGYARDHWMAYVTTGVAVAGVTAEFFSDTIAPGSLRGSAAHYGYAYGAGLETMLRSNIVLGIEYLRVGFLREQTHWVDDVHELMVADLNSNIIRARLSIKWGGDTVQYAGPMK